MTIRFLCPKGHKLAVPDDRAGKKGRCPICMQRVYVPTLDPLTDKQIREAKRKKTQTSAGGENPAPTAETQAKPAPVSAHDPRRDHANDILPCSEPDAPNTAGPAAVESPPDSAPARPEAAPHSPEDEAKPPLQQPSVEPKRSLPVDQEIPGDKQPGLAAIPITLPLIAPALGGEVPLPPESVPAASGIAPASASMLVAVTSSSPPSPQQPAASPSPPVVPSALKYPPGAATAQQPAQVPAAPVLEAYKPDPGKLQTVYMLATALVGLTVFAAVPALPHLNLAEAPGWARVVLLMTLLQLLYVAWMVSLPDWSTVWVGMVVFALVAAAYSVVWALVAFTPASRPITFLDLDSVRNRAAGWCFAILLLTTLLTYACGRFSGSWRKEFEISRLRRRTKGAP